MVQVEREVLTKHRQPLIERYERKKIKDRRIDTVQPGESGPHYEESIGSYIVIEVDGKVTVLPPIGVDNIQIIYDGNMFKPLVLDEEHPSATFINRKARKQLSLKLRNNKENPAADLP